MMPWHQRGRRRWALLVTLLLVTGRASAGVVERWVDAGAGDDGNPGSQLLPFATITHAIDAAGLGAIIHVNPGQYDAASGESFPILLRDNQQLIGDLVNRGQGTVPTAIVGNGPYDTGNVLGSIATVVCAAGSEISGFQIQGQTTGLGHTAIVIQGVSAGVSLNTLVAPLYAGVFLDNAASTSVEDCSFEAGSYGVYVVNCPLTTLIQGNVFGELTIQLDVTGSDSQLQVLNNEFLAGSDVGIHVQNGQPRLAGNTFHAGCGTEHGGVFTNHAGAEPIVRSSVFLNALGVKVTNGSPDLGIGSDLGQNDFTGVSGVSIQHDGTADVSAIGNSWPNDPPIVGVDIVLNSSGTVITTVVANRRASVGGLKTNF